MAEQDQPRNINEQETALIRTTFKENEALLQNMRAVMLGLDVTKEERDSVTTAFQSDELNRIIWKRFCPKLSKDSPIGQVQDVWLGAEQMIFGVSPETVKQALGYKDLSIKLTQQGLSALKDPSVEVDGVLYDHEADDELGITLLARNQYIRHVEEQLNFLNIIGNMPEQEKKDKKQDSSQ